MNQPCYNNLFQIIEHASFRNLNRVVLMPFDTVIKQNSFHNLMDSVTSLENQNSFKILGFFDTCFIKV